MIGDTNNFSSLLNESLEKLIKYSLIMSSLFFLDKILALLHYVTLFSLINK